MKKINAKVETFCMALLKEQLSDEEAAKVTKNSVVKAEYATNKSYHYAIAMSSKGMKSILKRMLKTKTLDAITLPYLVVQIFVSLSPRDLALA